MPKVLELKSFVEQKTFSENGQSTDYLEITAYVGKVRVYLSPKDKTTKEIIMAELSEVEVKK